MHDVLNDMVAGGCARTAPGGVVAALVFLEKGRVGRRRASHLLCTNMACAWVWFWTEHSERAGLVSVAAQLGVSKERRDFIGRWRPGKQNDDCVRTARQEVGGVQKEVARAIRSGKAVLDESDVFDGLTAFSSPVVGPAGPVNMSSGRPSTSSLGSLLVGGRGTSEQTARAPPRGDSDLSARVAVAVNLCR